MKLKKCREALGFLTLMAAVACSRQGTDGSGGRVTTAGTIEVTARLVEIRGDLPDIPLYDYAFVFKYEVLKTSRGGPLPKFIYVAQYLPLKPRNGVADERSGPVGGDLEFFRAGDIHRLALDFPAEDHYMGGLINRYFDAGVKEIYWAEWTNRVGG
jgi:hypothetical protein